MENKQAMAHDGGAVDTVNKQMDVIFKEGLRIWGGGSIFKMYCIQHSQSFVENGAENDLHSGGELQRKLREKEERGAMEGWVSGGEGGCQEGGEHLVSAISAKHSGG